VIAFSSEVELAAPSEAFFDAYAQASDAESSIFGAMAALEEQGREDHGKYGRTRKTCPYKIGTEERAAWLRGFDAAAALAKANGEQV
jgi:ribosome modulation factor